MISQQQMIEKFMPLIKAYGDVYHKQGGVMARQAQPGEVIQTTTKDGLETTNTAGEGDFIVRNPTGEQYIIKSDVMAKRYEQEGPAQQQGWTKFKAKGQVRAIQYNPQSLDMPAQIEFQAPWGESMVLKTGDMIATPDGSEIYRIARAEFEKTYAK
jgi:hypothetical protein